MNELKVSLGLVVSRLTFRRATRSRGIAQLSSFREKVERDDRAEIAKSIINYSCILRAPHSAKLSKEKRKKTDDETVPV